MTTLEQKADQVQEQLEQSDLAFGHGTDNAWEEATWLVLKAVGIEPDDENINWKQPLAEQEAIKVDQLLLKRISSRQPLAYLVNEAWFAGLKFYIDERALIPRSFLSEWIPDRFEPWLDADRVDSILDLCTGGGCIAIGCAVFFEQARVTASDLSADALEVAEINVKQHGLESRVTINQGDLFEGIDQRFDLIVCNPPYVSDERMDALPQEYRQEPDLAFRGGADGLDFIERLFAEVGDYLNDDGMLIVEAGSASHALEEKYPAVPFTWLSTEHDEMVVFMLSAAELKHYF